MNAQKPMPIRDLQAFSHEEWAKLPIERRQKFVSTYWKSLSVVRKSKRMLHKILTLGVE